jgi:succinate dehydrogenase / fumarate reductase cytochrome b subunit
MNFLVFVGAILRSQTGAWAWLLHRITGVGVLLFLLAHIVDTALIGLGPDAYEHALNLYRMPIFKVGEIALVFAVVYHSVNGIRVILVDFWEAGTKYHKQLFWASVAATAVLFLPVAAVMALRIVVPAH